MNRSLIILFGALALGIAIFAGAYCASQRTTMLCCVNPADDLNWLRTEFHLSDTEMARIRELHAGYLPQCGEICQKIAAAKRDLASIVGQSPHLTAEAQVKMNEIATLRMQCQSNMLQHFITVSHAMPPVQGGRYLAEMKKLTLGEHEQVEESMSGETGHEHHH
jgi:hypothetical protein